MAEVYMGFYETVPGIKNISSHEDVWDVMERLDQIENMDLTIESEGSNVPCPVSVASFLLGYCGNLAEYLHKTYGYRIGILYSINGVSINIEHVFNITRKNKKKYYIDSRGITSDYSAFIAPFSYNGDEIYKKEFRTLRMAKKWAPNWIFINDIISNAMIEWLVSSYPDYYKI